MPLFDDTQTWPPLFDWDFLFVPLAFHCHNGIRTPNMRVLRVFGLRLAMVTLAG